MPFLEQKRKDHISELLQGSTVEGGCQLPLPYFTPTQVGFGEPLLALNQNSRKEPGCPGDAVGM